MSEQISVLIIDDDRLIRQILQSSLSKKGFDVYTAENGPSGVDLARKENVDVILLDWMMPDMNGMEVLRQLKRDEITRQVPVFMLTCKNDRADVEQAISMGIDDYIVKPFNVVEVSELIVEKLKKFRDADTCKKRFRLTNIFSKNS